MKIFGDVAVVLVRPIYPRNIGMCARAMANMGFQRLIAIAPQCDMHHDEAKQGAAGAQEALQNAMVYGSLADFYAHEGGGIRVALSCRENKIKNPDPLIHTLQKIAQDPNVKSESPPLYLIFGPEDHGLSSEDLQLVHHTCELPTYGTFKSLNLSHAVLLTLEIVHSIFPKIAAKALQSGLPDNSRTHPDPRKPVYYPEETLQRWLETIGFDLSHPHVNALKVLNRILLENRPTDDELRVLEAIVQQTIRKLSPP